MKRIIQGLVLATLISTAQASPFPADGDPVNLPSWSAYADRDAGDGNMQVGSAFPADGDPVNLPSGPTYADQFTIDRAHYADSAIAAGTLLD